MRALRAFALASVFAVPLGLGFVSCQSTPQAPPAPAEPDFSAGHRALWSVFPKDAAFVLTAGKLGHVTDRLRALDRVISAGPIGKQSLDDLKQRVSTELGFDPLADASWQNEGIDLDGPAGVAWLPQDRMIFVVSAKDGAKAAAFLKGKIKQDEVKCDPVDKWVACHEMPEMPLVKQVDQSLASAAQTIDAAAQRLPVVAFVNAQSAPGVKDSPVEYLQKSQTAWAAFGAMPHAIRLDGGYVNPETKTVLLPYFERPSDPKAPPSLTTALRAKDDFVFRMAGNPKALWELAKRNIPPEQFDQALAGFTLVSGLDAEKDLMQNLTGEIAWIGGGKSLFLLIGVRDDAATKRVVERLDGLAATGITTLKQSAPAGLAVKNGSVELRGTKVYTYGLTTTPQLPNEPALQFDFSLSAGRGAVVIGFDAGAANVALERLANPDGNALATLPLEVQTALKTAAFASYVAPNAYVAWQQYPLVAQLVAINKMLRAQRNESVQSELDAVANLFYDAFLVGEAKPNGLFARAWLNLL